MGWLSRIKDGLLAALALLGVVLAAWGKHRAERAATAAAEQRTRADQAEAGASASRRAEQARTDVAQKHRDRQRDEQARLDAGQRDHFEEDW